MASNQVGPTSYIGMRETDTSRIINSFAGALVNVASKDDLAWLVVREVVGPMALGDC